MMRYIRDLRLIPIALIASACLLVLKVADLAFHGSSLFAHSTVLPADGEVSVIRPMPDATQPAGAKLSWAQQMFNFPNGSGAPPVPSEAPIVPPQIAERDNPDITGSVATEPAKASPDAAGTAPPAAVAADAALLTASASLPNADTAMPSGAERAILERLQQRREELDNRARELDIRESLIQGAEKRMDAKLAELKQVEAQIKADTVAKTDAQNARLKGLVTMYENMKPRDAAKIFDGLDGNVLIEVASQINPRQMADIVAQMAPEVAQRLTVELANKAQQQPKEGDAGSARLPKIEGQPTTQ